MTTDHCLLVCTKLRFVFWLTEIIMNTVAMTQQCLFHTCWPMGSIFQLERLG